MTRSDRVLVSVAAGTLVALLVGVMRADLDAAQVRLLLLSIPFVLVLSRRYVDFHRRARFEGRITYTADGPIYLVLATFLPLPVGGLVAFLAHIQADFRGILKGRFAILGSAAEHALVTVVGGQVVRWLAAAQPSAANDVIALAVACALMTALGNGAAAIQGRVMKLPRWDGVLGFSAVAVCVEVLLAFGPYRAVRAGDLGSFAVFAALPVVLIELGRRAYSLRQDTLVFAEERVEFVHLLIESDDRQRALLAGDLHDGPLQTTLAARLRLGSTAELLEAGDVSRAEAELARASAALETAANELRSLLRGLAPDPLGGGVDRAFHRLVQQYEDSFPQGVALRIDLPSDLDTDVAVLLYRIVHEATINAAQHAHADSLVISVGSAEEGIRAEVSDDGVGLSAARLIEAPLEGHLGLATLRTRVAMAGGTVTVGAHESGSGTSIVATIPTAAGRSLRRRIFSRA